MNPLRIYDYLVLARGKVLDAVRPLSIEQYSRVFPIGPGTLAGTLTHIFISEWYYIERLECREVPPYVQWPIQDEKPPTFAVLEESWARQAPQTRAAVKRVRDWDRVIEYRAMTPEEPPTIVTTTAGDLITQLVLHEVHHRAQALNMLRQLGVEMRGDIDFNALMYQRRKGW